MDWQLPRSALSVYVLTQLAVDLGTSPQSILDGTGLAADQVSDHRVFVTGRQELQVIRNLQRQFPDTPALGVEAGSRYHLTMLGVWGLAVISSPTLRAGLDVGLSNLPLAFGWAPVRFVEGDEISGLVVNDSGLPDDARAFMIERLLASLQSFSRDLVPDGLPITEVTFRHQAPRDLGPYRRAFGVEPRFGAAQNSIVGDSQALDLRLPQGDEWAMRTYAQLCGEVLAARQARSGFAGQVRGMVLKHPGAVASQEEVAAALHISPRTLFRRLEGEGTSYRSLIEEVRETLAEELLVTAQMTTEQVSFRLGYAEPASFVRAFKRWKGVSPQKYRVSLQGAGV